MSVSESEEIPVTQEKESKELGFFEKFLTLWVGLCILIGILLSIYIPGIGQAINSFSIGQISIPIGICLFLMMYPAMLNLQVSELKKLGRKDEAVEYMHCAIREYRQHLTKDPDSISIVRRLGSALAENGDFSEATKYFRRAVDMEPSNVQNHLSLARALVIQKHYDEAINQLHKGIVHEKHFRGNILPS